MKNCHKTVRVTLCAPGDVDKEITILTEVINEWNAANWDSRNCGIKVRHWTTDAVPDMADRGQGVINRQLIDDTDLVVAVFWSRLGTPTAIAESGTVEEVLRAMAQNKRVFLYFSRVEPLPANADQAQLKRLDSFRAKMSNLGLYSTFSNRAALKELFRRHLSVFMNVTLAKGPSKSPREKAAIVAAHQNGNGNIQIIGSDGAQVSVYQKPPVIKQVTPPPPGSLTPAEQRKVHAWIESLSEKTIGKTLGEAFAMWWSRLKKQFKVQRYEHIPSNQLADVEAWYLQQLGITKRGYRGKAPELWRNTRISAIKAAMKQMGREKPEYYEELSTRLKMKRPFQSLTELTKTDLERVYRMTLSDART